ncbi:CRISPR system precrRNA processing endoribonuclease RAMP protein Cas6 [Deferribacterales bacterium Es71-Z0220]|uniref:CRISPR system precrRNA processing endoribonuclease RAMP protein Cas6 n=1 Tax=Deferrivibrio essentukiensis TaxID=2880922 RepID=UPI001F61BF89|nr:CRISPR system precrRNA processing endoribonuclease RAMP protein Cas6 [Deferrivibrio essentukiensis]MCB4205236.1 CRISPR system precrRNA processing endoribonuclease RAMP protein Cas6 [Deferrivibrio essentukiensis]
MGMIINYDSFNFLLKLEKNIFTSTYPAFVLRSILGKELKRFACILRHKKCEECPLKFQCAYSYIFETPIKKDTEFLVGRDKASHPFTLYSNIDENQHTDKIDFTISLFGKGIEYFPYIFFGFLKGGENGIYRERTKYTIEKVTCNDFLVNDGTNDSIELSEPKTFQLDEDKTTLIEKSYSIKFITPVRLKVGGNYTANISYSDIIFSAFRRLEVLGNMYGKISPELKNINSLSEKEEKKCLRWKEYNRYSARQKSAMKLGGAVGVIDVKGKFTPFEISLLEFASIFGLGKNTGFGFGKVEVEEV